MDRLRSWTDDEETRFFSGEAAYEKTFTVPESMTQPGLEVRLDFGEGTPVPEIHRDNPGMQAWLESPVREAAVVYVNEQRAGSVWRPPYSVEVTGLLHSGENTLRVMVDNLAINGDGGFGLARLSASQQPIRCTFHSPGHEQPSGFAFGPAGDGSLGCSRDSADTR